MKKKYPKISVSTGHQINERGFTLISLLLALSIIFTTLPFLPFILNSIEDESYYDDFAVRQFFHFVNEEFRTGKPYSVEESILTTKNDIGQLVTIEKYDSIIRRRVSNQGHEILVRNIKHFSISPLSNGITIVVTTIEGESYEKTFSFYN